MTVTGRRATARRRRKKKERKNKRNTRRDGAQRLHHSFLPQVAFRAGAALARSQGAALVSPLQLPPPTWDGELPACTVCNSKFTNMRRRHHCRMCGLSVCHACSPKKYPLPFLVRRAKAEVSERKTQGVCQHASHTPRDARYLKNLIAPERVCKLCVPYMKHVWRATGITIANGKVRCRCVVARALAKNYFLPAAVSRCSNTLWPGDNAERQKRRAAAGHGARAVGEEVHRRRGAACVVALFYFKGELHLPQSGLYSLLRASFPRSPRQIGEVKLRHGLAAIVNAATSPLEEVQVRA